MAEANKSLGIAAGAAMMVLALAGCGDQGTGSEDGTGSGSGGSTADGAGPVAAEERTDDEWWEASLCRLLDLDELSASTGLDGLERQLGNGFDVGAPPVRTCSVGTSSGPSGTTIAIGVSVAPVDDETWAAAREQLSAVSESAPESIDVGDDAVASASVAMARVGERVVTVDTSDVDALEPDQLTSALEAAVSAADGYEPEGQQTIDACAAADAEAEALLGEEPTIRLDFFHPAFSVPVCLWATDSAGVRVSAIEMEDAEEWENDPAQGYDERVDVGLGGGLYLDGDDVMVVSWASRGGGYDATMEFVEGQPVSVDDAVALAEALEDLYE